MLEPNKTNGFQAAHAQMIITSFQTKLGRAILPDATPETLYHSDQIILSHNTDDDPILTYGNLAAQALWQMPWQALTQLPSRKTAETTHRNTRTKMFQAMRQDGYFENYQGMRVSATGQRFRIENAIIWTLTDKHGVPQGEAATFRDFTRF
ncbi:MEKHLA domain-containing protein [Cognatishimia sp. WU-CL00825]|uniref:MEKHLA domain-containing protein n=1 Tax=Cognatishimia sp. WU-CL00825 TaxID=3127658 RepID=UPI00310ADCE7